MTSEQFAYWLQGFAELHAAAPTAEQWQVIRDHLALVFDKRTPDWWVNQRQPSIVPLTAGTPVGPQPTTIC